MKIRVVVADDFPLTRAGISSTLRQDPSIEVVAEAGDGIEALEQVREHRPDIVVLDMRMPHLSGTEVLTQLREEVPETRVIISTASENPEVLVDAISKGAAGYLSKRMTGESLRQAVITVHGGGVVVSPELQVHLFRAVGPGGSGSTAVRQSLTDREISILRLVARGMTDNEIAAELFLSPRTVQNHLAAVREKTGARRRAELASWATEHALG